MEAIYANSIKLCMTKLAWGLLMHTRLDELDLFQGHRCVKIINCKLFFRFCSLDHWNISVLTLLDLSAAFDTTDHTILLQRLEHVFGTHDTAPHWFSSYFTNRNQTVTVNNCSSAPVTISSEVPQGSVLGPVLFVLYTAPLSNVMDSQSVLHHSIADNTQLQKYAPPQQVNELIQFMQQCVHDVKSWMTPNKLKLNDGKTEALIKSAPRI